MPNIFITRTGDGLEGAVAGQRIKLAFKVPRHQGGIRGECMGARLDCYWHVESNFKTLNPEGILLGEWAGLPIMLRCQVHLARGYALRKAEVVGSVGRLPIQVCLTPLEAPAQGSRVIEVTGTFDTEGVTLFLAIDSDHGGAHIHGKVGERQVKIHATGTSVTGEYEAAPPLFPLLIVPMIYFL